MHIQQCQCWTAPMIFIEKTAHFRRLKKTGYHPTDRPTDRPSDTTSYRDARTHLKTGGCPPVKFFFEAHAYFCNFNDHTTILFYIIQFISNYDFETISSLSVYLKIYSHKLYTSSIICFQGHHYATQKSFETWRSWWIDFEIYRKSYRLFQKLMLWNFITNFYAVIFLRIMNIRHFYGNWQIEFCKEIWLLRRLINGLTSKYLFSNFKDFKQFIWL